MAITSSQIWKWTLTKEAIAPCFVRDVLAMQQSKDSEADFFWLGHTPCRTVLLVGMVVAIQVYDKRTIYTIDDGTAVIDCVLRHPISPLPAPTTSRSTEAPSVRSNPQRSPPKKPRLDKVPLESMEPPSQMTEPGYPVRVVGRVVRHYESKQVHADTIDPCPSSLDEVTHLERVIELHKTKYSLAIPFVLPPKITSSIVPLDKSTTGVKVDTDASVFSDASSASRSCPNTTLYTLPAPPHPIDPSGLTPQVSSHNGYADVPSSPTVSSIVSSTPSSPCKPPGSDKVHRAQDKPRFRHPSRLHARDLTSNTFRMYVKYYMDYAPPPFATSFAPPSRSTCGELSTPRKHERGGGESDELTPRPRPCTKGNETQTKQAGDELVMGFTLSHLRRVPELALLAVRVARAETRRRDKVDREKERERVKSSIPSSTSASSGRPNEENNLLAPTSRAKTAMDPPRKKIKRLFSWAVVKLYEEGSIVLWDGEVRPLPVPPAPALDIPSSHDLRNDNTTQNSTLERSFMSCSRASMASVLYTASASASLYSHYHAPRRDGKEGSKDDVDLVDADADPAYLSDPPMDEEAYVPLTPQLLAVHVREAMGILRRRMAHGRGRGDGGGAGLGRGPTAEEVLAYMQRKDARWARVGVWAVEEAFAAIKVR